MVLYRCVVSSSRCDVNNRAMGKKRRIKAVAAAAAAEFGAGGGGSSGDGGGHNPMYIENFASF